MTASETRPVFDIEASVRVEAPPGVVYAVASDITRMGEWSPECTGGEWTSGTPGETGSRFTGHNRAGDRTWTNDCEVVAADGRRFAWAVLTASPDATNSVWSFEVEPDGEGTRLTQRFVLRQITEKMQEMFAGMSPEEFEAAVEGRKAGLQAAMHETVKGIKAAAEEPAA